MQKNLNAPGVSRRNLLSLGASAAAVGAGALVLARPRLALAQGNPFVGLTKVDFNAGGIEPIYAQKAMLACSQIANLVQIPHRWPSAALWQTAHSAVVAYYRNLEETGFADHAERNFSTYFQHHSEARPYVEANLRTLGVKVPSNWWGKMEESAHRAGVVPGYRASVKYAKDFYGRMAYLTKAGLYTPVRFAGAPPARATRRGILGLAPSPMPQSNDCTDENGNYVPCVQPGGCMNSGSGCNTGEPLCYDDNGNVSPCLSLSVTIVDPCYNSTTGMLLASCPNQPNFNDALNFTALTLGIVGIGIFFLPELALAGLGCTIIATAIGAYEYFIQ